MPRTGRPKIEIDQKMFETLCGIQCTEAEICDVLNVCTDTLNSWCRRTYKKTFSEVFKQKRGLGKSSLRRAQWLLATDSLNPTMLVWLGKQYLGQKDCPEDSMDMEDSTAFFDAAGLNDK